MPSDRASRGYKGKPKRQALYPLDALSADIKLYNGWGWTTFHIYLPKKILNGYFKGTICLKCVWIPYANPIQSINNLFNYKQLLVIFNYKQLGGEMHCTQTIHRNLLHMASQIINNLYETYMKPTLKKPVQDLFLSRFLWKCSLACAVMPSKFCFSAQRKMKRSRSWEIYFLLFAQNVLSFKN